MIDSLQTLEKIEASIDNIDLFINQKNLLSASFAFTKLKTLVISNSDVKQFLQDFGVFDSYRKRVNEKQK